MDVINLLLQTKAKLQQEHQQDLAAIDSVLAKLRSFHHISTSSLPRHFQTASKSPTPGSLRDWATKAFAASPGVSLSAPEVHDWSEAQGAKMHPDREKAVQAIGSVLRTMVAENRLQVVEQGIGRRASTYQWVGGLVKTEEVSLLES